MSQAAWISVLFLGVLGLLAWGLKRWKGQDAVAQRGELPQGRVLHVLRVGNHERVVTIEVGSPQARCQLVLGVTAQSVRTLHVLSATPAHVAPGADSLPMGFDAQLQRAAALVGGQS